MPLRPVLAIALSCCLGLAAHAQNSSKYLKSMMQEGYTLYFIKPVDDFNATNAKAQLIPDFTFQYHGHLPEAVDLRFSVLSESPLRETGNLSFYAGEEALGQSSALELMFLEQTKGRWHSRFTTTVPYSTLTKILEVGEGLEIRLEEQDAGLAFRAGNKWDKAAAVVKEILQAEVKGEEK